jgi:hypothetical protein
MLINNFSPETVIQGKVETFKIETIYASEITAL